MSYTLTFSAQLDPGGGVTVDLINRDGTLFGAAPTLNQFTAGEWYAYTLILPDTFQGYVRFTQNATVQYLCSINPQEFENPDVKTSQMRILGAGEIVYPVTNHDPNGVPLAGVEAWVTSDVTGTTVVAGTLTSDDSGQVVFMLDKGTYYLWRRHPKFEFTNPLRIQVT